MNIAHILKNKTSHLISVGPDQPLTEAVTLMAKHRIGSLAVMAGARVVSIVTERDVLCAVDVHGPAFASLRVKDVMAEKLVTCSPADSVDYAMDLMFHNETGHRIRHLPVIEEGQVVGIISVGDIVQILLTETKFENKLLRSYIKNWPED